MSWQDIFADVRREMHNPLVCLELEVIGDNVNELLRGLGERPLYPGPWVARILGPHPKFKFERQFLDATKGYAQANSIGSRGIFKTYWVTNGLYEVCNRKSWSKTRRYFIRVEGGQITEITEQELLQCLKNTCSA